MNFERPAIAESATPLLRRLVVRDLDDQSTGIEATAMKTPYGL
jgi:hypothetical protein